MIAILDKPRNAEKRIFGLDLLRCSAIVLVLLAHTLTILFKSHWAGTFSIYAAYVGVEIFFVLSGFLIGAILIKLHNKEPITTFTSLKAFWTRRAFRTLPNYYLVLCFYVLLQYASRNAHFISVPHLLSYLIFLQDSVSPETNNFFGVSWSLCIEEWFYLLFPLILFSVQFAFTGKKKSLLITILIFLLIPLLGRMALSVYGNVAWDAGFRKILFTRLDAIGVGVLAALVKSYHPNFWNGNKFKMGALGAAAGSILLIVFYYKFILIWYATNTKNTVGADFFMKTIFFTLFSFSVALLLPTILTIQVKSGSYLHRFISSISLTSYSIYLLHPIVMWLVYSLTKRNAFPNNDVITFSSIWILSITGSYFQYHLFEKRIMLMGVPKKGTIGIENRLASNFSERIKTRKLG